MIARSLKLALNYESYQSGQRCRRILDVRHWTEHKTRLCRAWAGLARRCRLPSQAGASRGRLESRGAATRNAVPSTCFSASASPVNHHRRYTAGFLSFSFFLLWGGTCSFRMLVLRPASQAGPMRNSRERTGVVLRDTITIRLTWWCV